MDKITYPTTDTGDAGHQATESDSLRSTRKAASESSETQKESQSADPMVALSGMDDQDTPITTGSTILRRSQRIRQATRHGANGSSQTRGHGSHASIVPALTFTEPDEDGRQTTRSRPQQRLRPGRKLLPPVTGISKRSSSPGGFMSGRDDDSCSKRSDQFRGRGPLLAPEGGGKMRLLGGSSDYPVVLNDETANSSPLSARERSKNFHPRSILQALKRRQNVRNKGGELSAAQNTNVEIVFDPMLGYVPKSAFSEDAGR